MSDFSKKVILFCDRAIIWGLYLLAFFIPFAFSKVTKQNFMLTKETWFTGGILVLFGLWIIRRIFLKKWDLYKSPLHWAILAYLLANILSFHDTINLSNSVKGLIKVLSFALLYLVAATSIRKREEMHNIAMSMIITGGAVSFYGIIQYFGIDPFFNPADVRGATGRSQVFSTFGNPTFLADYLVLTYWVAFFATINRASSFLKYDNRGLLGHFFALLAQGKKAYEDGHLHGIFQIMAARVSFLSALSMFLCILITRTRGAWVAWFASTIFAVLIMAYFRFSDIKAFFLSGKFKKIMLALAFALTIFFLFANIAGFAQPFMDELYYQAYHRLTSSLTVYQRFLMWLASWDMIVDRPFFGHGLFSFQIIYPSYQAIFLEKPDMLMKYGSSAVCFRHAHNEFVQTAVELGFVGLLAFLGIFFVFFRQCFAILNFENNQGNRGDFYHYMGYCTAIVAVLFQSVFNFPFHRATPQLAVFSIFAFITLRWAGRLLGENQELYGDLAHWPQMDGEFQDKKGAQGDWGAKADLELTKSQSSKSVKGHNFPKGKSSKSAKGQSRRSSGPAKAGSGDFLPFLGQGDLYRIIIAFLIMALTWKSLDIPRRYYDGSKYLKAGYMLIINRRNMVEDYINAVQHLVTSAYLDPMESETYYWMGFALEELDGIKEQLNPQYTQYIRDIWFQLYQDQKWDKTPSLQDQLRAIPISADMGIGDSFVILPKDKEDCNRMELVDLALTTYFRSRYYTHNQLVFFHYATSLMKKSEALNRRIDALELGKLEEKNRFDMQQKQGSEKNRAKEKKQLEDQQKRLVDGAVANLVYTERMVPWSADAWFNHGVIEFKRGNIAKTRELFSWITKINPGFYLPYLHMANLDMQSANLVQSKLHEKKEENLNELERLGRSIYFSANRVVELGSDKSDFDKNYGPTPPAIVEQGKSIKKNALQILDSIAGVYYRDWTENKDDSAMDRAQILWELCAISDPGYVNALFNLGVTKYDRGDIEGAKDIWQRVLKTDKGNKQALDALEKIERLPKNR